MSALENAVERMRADGASEAAVAAFRRRFEQLEGGEEAFLPGDELEPVADPPRLQDLPEPDPAVLDRVAVVKLNGGLGTSMGLRRAKSLIEVKPGLLFLDVIARQAAAAGAPLVLTSSFATAHDTAAAIGAEQFLQSRQPKLRADDHEPADWPADPALEWCPPGHGDLYASLAGSGMLASLRERGIDWIFVSNADNLGAVLEPRILGWADAEGVPFVMEVVRGTAADRKGGHIARHDGRLVLRETAQVPDGDDSFTDIERWRFYNTNNLWVDLRALERVLAGEPGGPPLPLIVNRKTIDPADDSSPAVLQLESAMGAAIGAIPGARAVHVPRARFAPVKTTDDLLVVRSDAYALGPDGRLEPTFDGDPPFVALDPAFYKRLDDFEARFPDGPPSLRRCRRLVVHGDVRFGAGVVAEGEVEIDGPAEIVEDTVLGPPARR